jgi:flagellar hook-length control protein FliK
VAAPGSSPDTRDTSSDGSAGGGTAPPAPAAATPDTDPVTDAVPAGLGTPAPVVAPTPVTPPVTATADGPHDPVAAQLAPQLAVLRDAPDGTQTMTLVVTPDSLGPVAVHVRITGGSVDMTLHGASEHGRHALTEALPDLRRDLEGAGLNLSRLHVDADGGRNGSADARSAQQLLADARSNGGHQAPPPPRSRVWAPPGTHLGEGGPVLTSSSSASPGVDVRV